MTHYADLHALSPSLSVRKAPSLHDFTLMLARRAVLTITAVLSLCA